MSTFTQEETPGPIPVTVDEAAAGARLDKTLTALLSGLADPPSRSRVRVLIETGHVTRHTAAGPQTVVEPSRKVKAEERFFVVLPPPEPAAPRPQPMPLDIHYEDAAILVLDKPAGLVVHPAPGNRDRTLVNALLAHCGDGFTGIGGELRPGIVHRIDKDTSGLLVIAKTERALKHLQQQFAAHGRDGRLSRAYTAFVWGKPDPYKGTIEAPLGRSQRNRRKMAIRRDGRAAITHYHVTDSFGTPAPVVSRLTCHLETGRTHQIRVHLTQKGHPLLADPLYGGSQLTRKVKLSARARTCLNDLGRQALHASELGFEHPESGEKLMFRSPLPPDLADLDSALRDT